MVIRESNEALSIPEIDPNAGSSPGKHYTADTVKLYDPTGLRSAMTASHEEVYKAIQLRMPDHNVRYSWSKKQAEIDALSKENGLLFPIIGLKTFAHGTRIKAVAIDVDHATW